MCVLCDTLVIHYNLHPWCAGWSSVLSPVGHFIVVMFLTLPCCCTHSHSYLLAVDIYLTLSTRNAVKALHAEYLRKDEGFIRMFSPTTGGSTSTSYPLPESLSVLCTWPGAAQRWIPSECGCCWYLAAVRQCGAVYRITLSRNDGGIVRLTQPAPPPEQCPGTHACEHCHHYVFCMMALAEV